MLGRSRLTAGFLAVAVAVALAQHAPPVGELEGRRCGCGGEGGAWEHLVPAASVQVSAFSCARGAG